MRTPFIFVLATPFFACSAPEGAPVLDTTGETRQSILNGAVDTELDGVGFWNTVDKKCAAAMLATSPDEGIGWAVSAGYCERIGLDAGIVFIGDDLLAPAPDAPTAHEVGNVYAHPYYLLQDFELMLLKLGAVTASTPTLPFLQPGEDTALGAGTDVVLAGYAKSLPDEENPHRVRRRTTKTISAVTSYQLFIDQEDGGACPEDQGGPVLVDVGGTLKVAGILTSVPIDCAGTAVAIRTAPLLDKFFLNYLVPGTNVPDAPCGYCRDVHGDGSCSGAQDNCDADAACATLDACVNACGSRACVEGCKASSPSGLALFEALQDCNCEACDYECVGEVACGGDGGTGAGGTGAGGTGTGGAGTGGTGTGGTGTGGTGATGSGGTSATGEGGTGATGEGGADTAGEGGTSATSGGGTDATGAGGTGATGEGGADTAGEGGTGVTHEGGTGGFGAGGSGTSGAASAGRAGAAGRGGSSAGESPTPSGGSAPKQSARAPEDDGCSISAARGTSSAAWGLAILALALGCRRRR